MAAQLRTLLRLDLDAVDWRKGLTGLVAIAIAIAIVAVLGEAGMAAGLAMLFVILADQPGPLRARALGVAVITLGGSAIAFVAIWAGIELTWVALLLTFLVTALGTLVAGYGPAYAIRGLLLSVWAIVALSLGGELELAISLTIAFAIGGLIAAVIIWLRARALPEPSLDEQVVTASRTLGELVRSPLGWFSLLRAGAATLALALGIALFPAHMIWGALTVLIVMRPKAGETVAVGVLRTIGTLVGIIAAEALLLVAGGDDPVLFFGLVVSGFGMSALAKVNYAVMVAFLTALLVFASELLADAGESAAVDRLLATIMGAAIAFIAIALGRWILARQSGVDRVTDEATGPVAPADDVPG
ncbi:MAG: FUSC family protein [Chloroflexota bacterium]|jgi:uncharacterized membrane protein YccC